MGALVGLDIFDAAFLVDDGEADVKGPAHVTLFGSGAGNGERGFADQGGGGRIGSDALGRSCFGIVDEFAFGGGGGIELEFLASWGSHYVTPSAARSESLTEANPPLYLLRHNNSSPSIKTYNRNQIIHL